MLNLNRYNMQVVERDPMGIRTEEFKTHVEVYARGVVEAEKKALNLVPKKYHAWEQQANLLRIEELEENREMRYFEFTADYFALIMARNMDSAMELYADEVADIGENMIEDIKEVSIERVIDLVFKMPKDNGFEFENDAKWVLLQAFNGKENCLLLVDAEFT